MTQCGHLYCWPCLFRWMEPGLTSAERHSLQLPVVMTVTTTPPQDPSHRVCPVCKSPCSVTSIIPIYVRNTKEGGMEHHHSTPTTNNRNDYYSQGTPSNMATNDIQEETNSNEPSSFPNDDNHLLHPEEVDTMTTLPTPPASSPIPNGATPTTNLGLRQRLRFRSDSSSQATPNATNTSNSRNDDSNNRLNETDGTLTATTTMTSVPTVPARPAPRPRRRSFSENAVGQFQQLEHNNNNSQSRAYAVSQGLALSLHRVLGPPLQSSSSSTTTTTTNHHNHPPSTGMIPPLHRREGHGSAARVAAWQSPTATPETDPDATEFLSRILLMLGSFVVLCLLLF